MITTFSRTSSEKGLASRNPVSILCIFDVLLIYLIVELFKVARPFIIFIIALYHEVTSTSITSTIPQDAPTIALIIIIRESNTLIPSISFLFFFLLLLRIFY